MFKKLLLSLITILSVGVFYAQECSDVSIEVNMDNFPQEASWQILNENQEVIATNDEMVAGTNSQTVCLPDGCYTLAMFDSFGDGWGFSEATGQVVVTTPSGYFEYIFDAGDTAFLGFGVNADGCEITVEGCTDSTATNYNPNATEDDGSCEYPCEEGMVQVTLYVCTFANGNEVAIDIVDEEGNIVYENSDFNDLEVMNTEICLDPEMCYTVNMYNTVNTGWYGGYYWVNVNGVEVSTGYPADDENYATAEFSTNGPCGEVILGCLDSTACNYDSNANWSDQSCTYPGCMDSTALNYNPEAGCEGDCIYPEPCDQNEVTIFIDMDDFPSEASWTILDDNSTVVYESSDYIMVPGENIFTVCLADGCYTLVMFDSFGDGWGFSEATGQVVVTTPSGVFEYIFDTGDSASLGFGVNADGCEITVEGCTDSTATNYNPNATEDDGSCEYPCEEGMVQATLYVCTFANGNEVAIDIVDEEGNIVYENSDFNDLEVMNTEICLDPEMCYTVNMYNTVNTGWYGGYYWVNVNGVEVSTGYPADDENYATAEFSTNGPCGEVILGCLDSTACNYDSNANWSDQSCTYPGCMDSTALNYNPEAGCEGDCIYPEPCDQNEVTIFIDMDDFPNEASWTILDDNSNVVYESSDYTIVPGENTFTVCLADGCYTLAMFDSFGDGWGFSEATGQVVVTTPSGVFEYTFDAGDTAFLGFGVNSDDCNSTVGGCTDEEACNYDSNADWDDQSCTYPGCMDSTAYNYDPTAGCDDDSCIYPEPVENDDCSDAISINCGDTVSGTTIGATIDDVDDCGTDVTAPGVWYTIVGADANINLSTCDQADYDTKISVFVGTCDALECVASNDDGGGCSGFTSYIDFWGEDGVTYYVMVHGWGSNIGTFELTATCSDVTPIYGCTDPLAINFNFEATVDDGSCEYGEQGCSANFAIYDIDEENNLVVIVNMSTADGLTYLWDFGDGTTSTEMLPVHFYAEDGTYTICLTVTNDELQCSDTFCMDVTYDGEGYYIDGQEVAFATENGFSINIIDIATVSIDETPIEENGLVIYPNPASNHLTVQVDNLQQGTTTYQVLDLTGKVALTGKIVDINTTIDVVGLSNGIYLLKLSNNELTQVQRFEISK